jgi:hypothetical protein
LALLLKETITNYLKTTVGNTPFEGLYHFVQRDKEISSDDKMIDIIRNLAEFEHFGKEIYIF